MAPAAPKLGPVPVSQLASAVAAAHVSPDGPPGWEWGEIDNSGLRPANLRQCADVDCNVKAAVGVARLLRNLPAIKVWTGRPDEDGWGTSSDISLQLLLTKVKHGCRRFHEDPGRSLMESDLFLIKGPAS